MMPQIPNEQTIDADWFNQCFQAIGIDAEVHRMQALRRLSTALHFRLTLVRTMLWAHHAEGVAGKLGRNSSGDPHQADNSTFG